MSRDPLAKPEELIRRVYAYVAYRIGHGSDAEDITSETMLRAVRYRSSWDPRKGKPISWLIGIARTCIAEHLAGRAEQSVLPLDLESQENVESEAVERIVMAAAVQSLEPRDRELIALRYGADLSAREIARLLGLTPNAVDVALHRSRARLRRELEGTSSPQHPSFSSPAPSAEPGL